MSKSRHSARGSLPARVIRTAGNLVVAAVLLLSLAFILPSLFGYERYVITGGSMSGTFEKGAVAFERTVPVEKLKVGDVITYLPPPDSGLSTLVTHRIVTARTTDAGVVLRTQGDANADPDPWRFTLHDTVQPKVEFTVPAVGWLFLGLADREIRMLLIGVPAVLVALHSLREIVQALREAAAKRRMRPAVELAPTPSRTLHTVGP